MLLDKNAGVLRLLKDVASDALAMRPNGLTEADQLEMAFMEGLLTAAAIGPQATGPDDWITAYFGPHYTAADPVALKLLKGMFAVQSGQILDKLRRDEADFEPDFLGNGDEVQTLERAKEWASGFVRGVHLRRGSWRAITDDQKGLKLLQAIALRLENADGKPLLDEVPSEQLAELRLKSLTWLGETVYAMFLFWEERRPQQRREPRVLGKLGRNDPCACGSGKKYKKCCLN